MGLFLKPLYEAVIFSHYIITDGKLALGMYLLLKFFDINPHTCMILSYM